MAKPHLIPTCDLCGRALTDADSIQRGLGPDCAEKAAGWLASGGLGETDFIALTQSDQPDARRWLRSCWRALRYGDPGYARRFLANALHAAGLALPSTITEEA